MTAISIAFHQRHSISCGLSAGGWPILFGHLPFAYVYESHELTFYDGDVAEMFFS
jgi:hypothetical protein